MFTSIKVSIVRPRSAARRPSARASSGLSSDCTMSNSAAAFPALFRCRCPRKWSRAGIAPSAANFCFGLLHVVFAQLPDSGGQRLADRFYRLGFAYCHQADRLRTAAGLLRGARDPFLNVNQILGNRFHAAYLPWRRKKRRQPPGVCPPDYSPGPRRQE